MAYEVILNLRGVYRILLEPREEGCYVNVFADSQDLGPSWDWLQDDLNMAMHACFQDYGVSQEMWKFVANEPIHSDNTDDQLPKYPITRGLDGRVIE